MDKLIKELEMIAEIDRQNEEREEEMAKELTTREWKLIYDAIQYRVDHLEELAEIQTVDKFKNGILNKIEELEVILYKIGEKTI